jgi:hypothetical protein
MIRDGLYSIEGKALDGVEGGDSGVLVLRDGTIRGGTSFFYFVGTYSCSGGRWKGEMTIEEHTRAPPTRPMARRLVSLALQLHLSSEVSTASVGLVSSPPERPCENTVDRDAPLSELDSDATDFLDRPADQERCLVRRRRVFLSAGSALAR